MEASCNPPFTQYSTGCYLVPESDQTKETWVQSEANCQMYGSNVHLMGPDTVEVCSIFVRGP